MPAPTMSHLICVGALIVLIFTVQVFFLQVVDNSWAEMAKRELKELTDYVADTVANLYFLVNSTQEQSVVLQKTLSLPSAAAGSSYVIQIMADGRSVKAYFVDKTWLSVSSWLPPGLTVDAVKNMSIESAERTVIAGCSRTTTSTYVWMTYG